MFDIEYLDLLNTYNPPDPGPTDHGKSVNLQGQDGGSVSGSGGGVNLTAGSALGSGDDDGGHVTLTPGDASGSGVPGCIILRNIPTTDPGILGALWLDNGVFSLSAG